MHWKYLFLTVVLAASVFASPADAGGTYYIGRDGAGIYMETDQDGSWYIDDSHARDFSLGEKGTYVIVDDQGKTLLKTDKGKTYPINMTAHDEWERERERFNASQRIAEGIETPITLLNGRHVLVPVTLGNQGRQLEVMLLLDTGASITVLHKEAADMLRLNAIRKSKLRIADGSLIESDLVSLDSVDVGPINRRGLLASVIPHMGPLVPYQGLLGMNFLKGLDYRIDFDRQVIKWKQ